MSDQTLATSKDGRAYLGALVHDPDVPFRVDERCEYLPALRTRANISLSEYGAETE